MKLKCLYPFTFLEFHPQGKVYCCCPAWTKYGPVGNIYKQSIEEIWNGKKIVELRKKIYEGKYSKVCKLGYCPFIKNPININYLKKKASKKLLKIIKQVEQRKVYLKTKPLEVSLAHNGQCNLRCKMCISHEGFNPYEKKLEKIIFTQALPSLLPGLEYLKLNGNGDPFFQTQTVNFLKNFKQKKFPRLKFQFLTNALFLNKEMWSVIKHLNIDYINVSIDAAGKKVYEEIRRGGNWELLQKNLKFISQLRKKGKIKKFFINMTVMKSNAHQLEEFAKMGLKLGCDHINFSKIFGGKNFKENIFSFPHQALIEKIKQSLKNPIFKNAKVSISQIKELEKIRFSLLNKILIKIKFLFSSLLYHLQGKFRLI